MNKTDFMRRLTNTKSIEKEIKSDIPDYFTKETFEEAIATASKGQETPSKDLTNLVGAVWNHYNIEYESERKHLVNRIKDAVCVFYGPVAAEKFEKTALGLKDYLKIDYKNHKNDKRLETFINNR